MDPLATAKKEHAHGQTLFDTTDYDGAIEAWTRAIDALPPKEPKSATYRPLILYNIAAARERLFDLSQDKDELRRAKILLERFDASIDEVYGHDPEMAETERTRVREKIAALDVRINAAEKKPDPPVTDPAPKEPDVAPPTTDRDLPSKPGNGLMIGGGVMVGLGAAAIGGLIAGLVIGKNANDIRDLADDDLAGREERFARGDRANSASIAMGVVAPLLVGGGVALLVIGAKRNRSARVSAAPSFGPHGVAWVLRGRF